MKKLQILAILFLSLSIGACSSDDDNTTNDEIGNEEENPVEVTPNHFTHDDSEILIVDSVLEYGEPFPQTGSHIVTLMMTNSALSEPDYQPEDPVFSAILFGIFTGSSTDLELGTYNYSQSGAAGTYALAAVALDLSEENQNPENIKEITSGTLTVEENGDNYAIYFEGSTVNGAPVSLHYEGAINHKVGFASDSRMANPNTPVKRLMKSLQE